jgi:hypothetical protein
MIRALYVSLLWLHPPQFRCRFGDEILCIFDEADTRAAWALVADGFVSLLRQWALRSAFPIILLAFLGAAVQMALVSFVWLGALGRMAATNLALWSAAQTPQDAGMLLLLIAGLITAVMLAATAMATWCVRLCACQPGGKRT